MATLKEGKEIEIDEQGADKRKQGGGEPQPVRNKCLCREGDEGNSAGTGDGEADSHCPTGYAFARLEVGERTVFPFREEEPDCDQ